jgi:hypothetical protein
MRHSIVELPLAMVATVEGLEGKVMDMYTRNGKKNQKNTNPWKYFFVVFFQGYW